MFHGSDFMFEKLNILDEKDKRLRIVSTDITKPLTKEEQKELDEILKNISE